MVRIASFCVDHTKLDRGMYLSRQDGDDWDLTLFTCTTGGSARCAVRCTRVETAS